MARNERYRHGKGKEPSNVQKMKASRKAYVSNLHDAGKYNTMRKEWKTKERQKRTKLQAAKAQYYKRRSTWLKTEQLVEHNKKALLRGPPIDSEENMPDDHQPAPLTTHEAMSLAKHYAAVYEMFQELFLADMERRTERLASKCKTGP